MNNIKYIFFTLDALHRFLNMRQMQSVDFPVGKQLCEIATGSDPAAWQYDHLMMLAQTKNGLIFYTPNIDRENGLLFDLTTFTGFNTEINHLINISNILTKTIRYAVKEFTNAPKSSNERYLPAPNITLVFPYQFSRSAEVYKVVVDCNNSDVTKRKGYKYLTAFSYEQKQGTKFSDTILRKVVDEIMYLDTKAASQSVLTNDNKLSLDVTELDNSPLQLDMRIGFDNWRQYLTESQKEFIFREFSGPERLEGAAGSGKTLSMCLKIIYLLKQAELQNLPLNIIYFTHSLSTKEIILDALDKNCADFKKYHEQDYRPAQSVRVCTLQEWCAEHLGINELTDNEFIDKDAGDSKFIQTMYIEEAWNQIKSSYYPTFSNRLSDPFKELIENTPNAILLELLQREFSEIIKGQAKGKQDVYLTMNRPEYAISLQSDFDRRLLFQTFNIYQEKLNKAEKFDSDDIVITAIGQLDAPIWNRRRSSEGYDICFIDETQLFNLNEISVFHLVNKPDKRNNIVFCIDRSQGIGDTYRADTHLLIDENGTTVGSSDKRYDTIFRSSPDITALAFSILTSGAIMFKTLENPIENTSELFVDPKKQSRFPEYILKHTAEDMIKAAFSWAQKYQNETDTTRNKIIIVATDDVTLNDLLHYARTNHKPFVKLNGRGDITNIRAAINDNKFLISSIDYIGGLECDAVVIVGVDGQRVPPEIPNMGTHIINYAWYNRMYVAVTRAKYAVALIGEGEKISPILESSINNKTLHRI